MQRYFKPLFGVLLILVAVQQCNGLGLKMRPAGSLQATQDSLKIAYQNEDYFQGTVTLSNAKTISATSSINFKIVKTPPNNLVLKIFLIKEENGQYHAEKVTPIRHGICQYVKSDKILYPGFLKYGQLPRACPIKTGEYYVTNYKVPMDELPPVVPPGRYKIIFDVSSDSLKVLTIEWVGSILLKDGAH